MAGDSSLRELIHSYLRYLHKEQDPPAPTLRVVAATPHSPRTIGVSLDRFHSRAPTVTAIRRDLHMRGLTHQDSSLYPSQPQCHCRTNRGPLLSDYLQQPQTPQ